MSWFKTVRGLWFSRSSGYLNEFSSADRLMNFSNLKSKTVEQIAQAKRKQKGTSAKDAPKCIFPV